jgi:hypothetical protein
MLAATLATGASRAIVKTSAVMMSLSVAMLAPR